MDTKIVSGFPGVGKSFLTGENIKFADSDSSLFSWLKDEFGQIVKDVDGKNIRNPNFPTNYIAHIKEQIGKVPAIFVSSHQEVRDALVDSKIPFTLVYPDPSLLDEYVIRYEKRGSPAAFIEFISKNWNKFIDELSQQSGCEKIMLGKGQYLKDVIGSIASISKDKLKALSIFGFVTLATLGISRYSTKSDKADC